MHVTLEYSFLVTLISFDDLLDDKSVDIFVDDAMIISDVYSSLGRSDTRCRARSSRSTYSLGTMFPAKTQAQNNKHFSS